MLEQLGAALLPHLTKNHTRFASVGNSTKVWTRWLVLRRLQRLVILVEFPLVSSSRVNFFAIWSDSEVVGKFITPVILGQLLMAHK